MAGLTGPPPPGRSARACTADILVTRLTAATAGLFVCGSWISRIIGTAKRTATAILGRDADTLSARLCSAQARRGSGEVKVPRLGIGLNESLASRAPAPWYGTPSIRRSSASRGARSAPCVRRCGASSATLPRDRAGAITVAPCRADRSRAWRRDRVGSPDRRPTPPNPHGSRSSAISHTEPASLCASSSEYADVAA